MVNYKIISKTKTPNGEDIRYIVKFKDSNFNSEFRFLKNPAWKVDISCWSWLERKHILFIESILRGLNSGNV